MLGYVMVRPDEIKTNIEDIYSDADFMVLYEKCRNFTMTSIERMHALYQSCEYVVRNKIPGDFVECGVWKGGSSMLMALTLLKNNVRDKKLFLYDTYAGMSKPGSMDVNLKNEEAIKIWKQHDKGGLNEWCYAPMNEVRDNMHSTGYPSQNIVFVKGRLEESLPNNALSSISILRLDTDWFESTYHSLKFLYPKLTAGGILIIDDYGHWKGAKMAADKYFGENRIKILLNRIDYTGRIAVKT